MKTAELTGAQLDYWVAKAEGFMRPRIEDGVCVVDMPDGHPMQPSTNWAQGGPIIDRNDIQLGGYGTSRFAEIRDDPHPWVSMFGESSLIAAMRAKVASVYGDEAPEATL